MFAHCVYCPVSGQFDTADEAEIWAANHEQLKGKHSVKVEGYEGNSDVKA